MEGVGDSGPLTPPENPASLPDPAFIDWSVAATICEHPDFLDPKARFNRPNDVLSLTDADARPDFHR